MTQDELEFQISQYLDQSLTQQEQAALEERFAVDAGARQMLAEYRRLNEHLDSALALPNVQWDQLAEHLSSAIDQSNDESGIVEESEIAGRIGPVSWTWRARLAIAAGVAIVLGTGLLMYDHHQLAGQQALVNPLPVNASALVMGPQVEPPTGPVVQEIHIGPSPALAAQGGAWRYAEGVVTRPSVATIAGEVKPATGSKWHIH